MSLRDYFDAEMRLLHEEAIAFAEKYPEQAAQLSLKSLHDRDPHIERLLEGVAFLTANIRAKLDDDIPEICATFLQQCWPQLLFPFPSATILEFSWRAHQLTKALLIPKYTLAQSSPVGEEKTACRFSTIADVVLRPLKLIDFAMTEPTYGGTLFQFEFEHNGEKAEKVGLNEIIFYLHADPSISLELFWALTGQVTAVYIFSEGQKIYVGDQSAIMPAYLSEEETLLPLIDNSFYGFHLLQDYFAFREKYFFIKIKGLDNTHSSKFGVEIYTQKIFPPEIRIKKDNFKLHCIPAINIYSHLSEPIQYTENRFSYPLVIDHQRKESLVLQAVVSVNGVEYQSGIKKNIESFSSFTSREKQKNRYQLEQGEQGNYMKFSGKSLAPADISCLLNVSNGHYPRQYLQEGSIHHVIDQPNYICVKNITRPSSFLPPSKKENYRWDLISALSFQFNTLNDKENLKNLLSLFDFTDREENHKKISAIYRIEMHHFERLQQAAFRRGITIRLYLEESGFRNLADMYLFGNVLHHFFMMYAPLNLFVETRCYANPSQREFLWKAQCGKQALM